MVDAIKATPVQPLNHPIPAEVEKAEHEVLDHSDVKIMVDTTTASVSEMASGPLSR